MNPPAKTRFDVAHQCVTNFLRVVFAIGIGLQVVEGLWRNAAIATGILLLTFLPAILARRVDVHIPPEFELLTIAFIYASTSGASVISR